MLKASLTISRRRFFYALVGKFPNLSDILTAFLNQNPSPKACAEDIIHPKFIKVGLIFVQV